ncbi:hypothetical protein EYF80_006760 [Liparis tanakae]|uniref:Uncharacterized protein n=1 Tax=Liparis tanakae TaxID=230148 RepID=A0A4Z2J119_9TELE|nr:hypothetical protein EYF80_006760 [Liparis tanakae]
MVKDGSILTASGPRSVSWPHASAVLEPLSVTPFQIIKDDVDGDSCLSEEGEFNGYVKCDWQAKGDTRIERPGDGGSRDDRDGAAAGLTSGEMADQDGSDASPPESQATDGRGRERQQEETFIASCDGVLGDDERIAYRYRGHTSLEALECKVYSSVFSEAPGSTRSGGFETRTLLLSCHRRG